MCPLYGPCPYAVTKRGRGIIANPPHLLLLRFFSSPFPPLPPPSILLISLLLSFSSAPRSLPMAGKSTALSPPPPLLRPRAADEEDVVAGAVSLSSTMPFSRASLRRRASRSAAAPVMPRRIAMGILLCASTLSRPPSARRRMSVVSTRRRPSAKTPLPLPLWWGPLPVVVVAEGSPVDDVDWAAAERAAWSERILLSDISLCRARSLARKVALSSSWDSGGLSLEDCLVGSVPASRGGRDD